jgi:hypothetical protein
MLSGSTFIIQHWGCKYIDARIDMRTGSVYLAPGNAPQDEKSPGGQV